LRVRVHILGEVTSGLSVQSKSKVDIVTYLGVPVRAELRQVGMADEAGMWRVQREGATS
jgi:hypothetical protein